MERKKSHWTDKLIKMDACESAVTWCRNYDTFEDAWDACEHIEWLLWLIYWKKGHKEVVRLASQYSRIALNYSPNQVAEHTIGVVEAWLDGKASREQVKEASREAREAGNESKSAVWAAWTVWTAWAEWAEEGEAAISAAGKAASAADMQQCLDITKQVKITL